MGGMKSGTGDVWGDDEDEDEENESIQDEERQVESESSEAREHERTGSTSESGFPSESESSSREGVPSETGKSDGSSAGAGSQREDEGETESSGSDGGNSNDGGDSKKPYVVRRMLKDKSVQFERDERLTLFVHDDVKSGEQELEAHAQDRFGRDIPVFDIREAVYRAALRNRDDVVDELEEMGYTRD